MAFREITKMWYQLGMHLLPEDICEKTLDEIKNDDANPEPPYKLMLNAWMEHHNSKLTWEALLDALKYVELSDSGVSGDELADAIEKWLEKSAAQGSCHHRLLYMYICGAVQFTVVILRKNLVGRYSCSVELNVTGVLI